MSQSNKPSLKEYVSSDEPLSEEAVQFILDYKGEPLYLDCKESFDPNKDTQWIGIAKDIYAFANTHGGYLVFGKKDETWKAVDLPHDVARVLCNTDNIHKKVNRHIEPNITNITAILVDRPNRMVILHIPESLDYTHIVTKVATAIIEKKDKTLLREGEIYVRHSGGTARARPEDIERIINKRVERRIKIVRDYLKSPSEYHLVRYDNAVHKEKPLEFKLTSDRKAQPVVGLPSTTIPQNDVEELMMVIGLYRKDNKHLPKESLLLRLYADRNKTELTEEELLGIVELCIVEQTPCLCWVQNLKRVAVHQILKNLVKAPTRLTRLHALRFAEFVSLKDFDRLASKMPDSDQSEINRIKQDCVLANNKRLKPASITKKAVQSNNTEELEKKATELAKSLSVSMDAVELNRLRRFDRDLYFDQCQQLFLTKKRMKALISVSSKQ